MIQPTMAEAFLKTSTKRIAVVTGANKGIGLEICRQLASNGVIVVLTARDDKRGNEALDNLKKDSGFGDDDVFFYKVDVMDSNDINSLADFVKTQFGKLDILVNNAGITGAIFDYEALSTEDLGDKPEDAQIDWSKIVTEPYELALECLETNYYGPKRMIEELIPLLKLSDSPRIVSVSAAMGQLKNIPNGWANGVLNEVKNLTEEKIEEGKRDSYMAEPITYTATKRIAVVTGANKGIGFDICRQLASNGVTVVLTARNEKRGNEALDKLKKDYGFGDDVVFFHRVDVMDSDSINTLADFVKTQFGKLDILVNNAGIAGFDFKEGFAAANFGDNPAETQVDWSNIATETYKLAVECLQTNYYGPKLMIEALTPLLELSDSPRVVTVSSSVGKFKAISNEWAKGVLSDSENLKEEKVEEVLNQFLSDFKEGVLESKGWPTFLSAYTVSKASLNAYTRIAAKNNPTICINCICPGFVKTDLTLNKGTLTVEEGASSPVRLALLPHGGPSGLFYFRDQVSSFE